MNSLFETAPMRKESIPSKSLNLTKDDGLQKVVEACRERYVPLSCIQEPDAIPQLAQLHIPNINCFFRHFQPEPLCLWFFHRGLIFPQHLLLPQSR